MKYISTLVILFSLFISKAQCVVDTNLLVPGFYPDTGSFVKPICAGSKYEDYIQIYNPSFVSVSSGVYPVNYVQLDSIPALPQGLTYTTNPSNGYLVGGERGCITISGITNLPAGNYEFTIYYTANFTAFGNALSLLFVAPYKVQIFNGAPVFSSKVDTGCASFGYALSNRTVFNSGIYNDTLTASGGCDSIVTIDLFVRDFDTTVVLFEQSLIAPNGYANYTLYNCGSTTPILTQSSNIFLLTQSGSYFMAYANQFCSFASRCFDFVSTGLNDLDQVGFNIYPNPNAERNLTVEFANITSATQVTIINLNGQAVLSASVSGEKTMLEVSALEAGVYFLQVQSPLGKAVRKLLLY